MKEEQIKALVELDDKSEGPDDFAKKGCDAGLFVSRSQGRRMWTSREVVRSKAGKMSRVQQIRDAAEKGIVIDFKDGEEAKIYREEYIKTHSGAIDVESKDSGV